MAMSKFLDPKNDFAFKKIFGSERNKDILIHFLNDILGFQPGQRIQGVTFLKPIQDPEVLAKKQSIVDVLCEDEMGRKYIIEMQVAKVQGFEKRAMYYAAKAYVNQLNTGESYSGLKEIIFIAITDFVMFPDKPQYKSDHVILDKESYANDLKDFSFTFLELPKFNKTIDELKTMAEKWVYFFKHADETTEAALTQIVGQDVVIEKAYSEINKLVWSPEEIATYEQDLKSDMDFQGILLEAKDEGFKEGKSIGLEEGVQKGLQQGKAEGLQQGKAEGLKQGQLQGERSVLIYLLEDKFKHIPAAYREQIAHASPLKLRQWLHRVVISKTLESVFEKEEVFS